MHYQDQLVHPEQKQHFNFLLGWSSCQGCTIRINLCTQNVKNHFDFLIGWSSCQGYTIRINLCTLNVKNHFHFLIGIIYDMSGMHTTQWNTHSWWSLHQGYTLSSTHLISLSLQQMVRSLLASSSMTLARSLSSDSTQLILTWKSCSVKRAAVSSKHLISPL